jgi:hypothetical protein
MKLFDHVAIAGSSESTAPLVLHSVLEQFGLHVHLYRFYQKRNVEDFFAGKGVPKECRYTVLLGHGHGPDDDPKVTFEVVDQKDGNPNALERWEPYACQRPSRDAGGDRLRSGAGAFGEGLLGGGV